MDRSRQPVVNTLVGATWVSEWAIKLVSAIDSNVVWYAAYANHLFEKHSCSSDESISFLHGRKIAIFVNQWWFTKIPIYPEAVDSRRSPIKSIITPS